MAYTVTFNQDTDKPGVGTLTATDGTGFAFSKRVDTRDGKAISAFVAEALAAAKAVLAARADTDAVVAKVAAVLNAEVAKDPALADKVEV